MKAVSEQASPALKFVRIEDLKPSLSNDYLIEGLFHRKSKVLIYGDSNVGKSFIVQGMLFHVALGKDFHGRKSKQGAALYVAAEDGGSIPNRFSGQLQYLCEKASNAPIGVFSDAIDLLNPRADLERLIQGVKVYEAETGRKVEILAVDTFSSTFSGDENSQKDIGAFNRNIERLRSETQACIVIIDHAGKDGSKGARGGSGKRASADTEIFVSESTFKVTKQRNGPKGDVFGFELQEMTIGTDAESGTPITTCVSVPREPVSPPIENRIPERALQALEVLRSLTVEPGQKIAVRAWKQRFGEKHYAADSKNTVKSAFRRASETLFAKRFVHTEGDYAWLNQ